MKKRKIGRKLLSFLLTLAMVFGIFTGIVPGTGITAKADTSDTGVEVLIADIDCEHYKDKTTSFTTDDGLANISFSATPTFDDEHGWYNPNGELTITVTAANEDYPISKCVFQCCGEGREDSTAPFEVTISHGGNWQNTTATINGVTESSGGLRNIGFFSRVTPDHTVLKDGMLIKPGESIIPGDYYYKTAGYVNTEFPEQYADFKQNTLYVLVRGKIESRQVDPSCDPDLVEDVFVESNNGDHYAFLQVADGKYIFDGSWEVTNHADGLLVSQGTSENMNNPEERITTYAFSVHEKVFNDVTVDSTIENGSIEIKDSEGTAISEAEAGSIVTLDVSANTGYKLKEISAKYLEIQSVSELMEMMGDTKYYANPNDTDYSDYYMATADGIKCFLFFGEEKAFLSKTAELDKSKSAEGVYTASGKYNYNTDIDITWKFTVKKGKIIAIAPVMNEKENPTKIESTGTIAEPTYASVELTTVTEGEKYTFTMPATEVTVNAVFEEDSAQNTWTSGDCTVTYDSDTKTMTVTGNGAMGSYESEDQVPWKDVIKESVEKIVIDEGVTSIGENVFYHCDSVKEIYISSTVRNIKNQAFYNYSMYSSNVYFTRPSVDCELQIDGMPFNLDYWTLNYSGDGKYVLYDKNIDLENASSVTKLIGNWEADGAGGSIYTTKIFTWKIPTSSITCISEHGVVTASVGGTDVTTAEVGDEVTLKVKPDLGYQLKSITATFPKDGVETFDDLVGLMGDAVINGDTKNQFGEYTCKVENGQFAIYNGNDLVSRTSDITDFEVRDNGHTIIFNSGNLGWYFGLDRDTGNIIVISVSYISDWNSAFVSADNSESTGTLPPNEVSLTTVKEGSDYKFLMPKRDVTIKTEYEKVAVVTKAPEAKTLTYNGQEQELVTAGSATGGVMQYALGTKTEDTGEYSTSIPTATAAGTYYVWYKVIGDENHTDSEAKCITVTISSESSGGGGGSSSSGGGSSTPSTPTTPTESYTVPVSSENTVNVTTNISNGTAVVSEITQSDIDKIVDNGNNSGGGDNTEASENTSITIDVSQAKSEVTSVQLSEKTVEKLTEAVKADNNVESVEIKMTNATIELDGAALSAVSEQAEGSSIKLVVEDTQTTKLNATQQESLRQFASAKPFQAYFESNGKEIHDFKGGKATVSIKFSPESGRDVKHYHMYYLPVAGAIERYVTRYVDGMLSFVTTHFSDYAIVYDETMENETGKDDGTGGGSSETGGESNGNTANGKTAYQNALSINKGLKVSQIGNKITVSWGKVSGANRYEIYVAYCTGKFGKTPVKVVTKKGVTSVTITKLNGKKLVLTKNFKAYVVAYKTVDGSKKKLGKTITAHIVGRKNKTYTNVKAIKLAKNKATIKVGKTYKIKASVVLVDSKKKMLSDKHAATFRYASSDKKIATVDKNGKVIAKKVGTCYIWIYTKNGNAKKVKITVK